MLYIESAVQNLSANVLQTIRELNLESLINKAIRKEINMVRIALISDIHFGKLSRTAEFSVPGEKIQDENSGGESLKNSMISVLRQEKAQYICVAGDLTSVGSPQEFLYCQDMLLDLATQLDIPVQNILVGLGNHDIDWNISNLHEKFPSTDPEFPLERVKEQYRKIAASAPTINLESIPNPNIKGPAPFSGITETDSFVMFLLNTGWCCTQSQAISHGKLDETQLSWFRNEAAKYKTLNKWKIVLMHHHPFNYTYPVPGHDTSALEEGSNFLEIAGENGFHLVIHGHRHHPRAETTLKNSWRNPITFVCAGSFSVNSYHRSGGSIPNTLHIVALTDDIGVINLKTFQYSPAQGWIPLATNCPETPLDYTMRLGKIFSPKDIEKSIEKLSSIEGELKWDTLDECLQFMPYYRLNECIKSQLKASRKMIGLFPDDVILLERRG